MKDFRLTNLRVLSTEEQLRINGGSNDDVTCSCSPCPTCSCGTNPTETSSNVSKGVTDSTVDAINNSDDN